MRDPSHSLPALDRLAVDTVAHELRSMFELRACRFEPFPFDTQLPRIEPGRIVLPAPEPGAAPWQLDAGVELPVRLGNVLLGRFVLVAATPTSGVCFSAARRTDAIRLAERAAPRIARSILAGTPGA
jgi:hypothetical protein